MRGGRSETSEADYQDTGALEARLLLNAETGQGEVAGVAGVGGGF
jgi:hypothetical protein